MCALLVTNLGKTLLGQGKDFSLVDTAKLGINLEVLLVKGLHDGIDERGQGGIVDLLDDLCTSLLGVVHGGDRLQSKAVHGIFLAQLVAGSEHELELLNGRAGGLE